MSEGFCHRVDDAFADIGRGADVVPVEPPRREVPVFGQRSVLADLLRLLEVVLVDEIGELGAA